MKTYRYTGAEKRTIRVTDDADGSELFVPVDPANRHYAEILKDKIVVEDAPPTIPPPPPPAVYSKRKLFGTMTDAEYDTFEVVETQQNKRKRRVFRESTELNESDKDFPEFRTALEATFPNGRAAELLAAARIN